MVFKIKHCPASLLYSVSRMKTKFTRNSLFNESLFPGSNWGPLGYKANALPTELKRQLGGK